MKTMVMFFLVIMFFAFSPLSISIFADAEEMKKTIVAGYNAELPPFSYQDKNGNPAGYSIDIMKEIEQSNGLKVKYVPLNELDQLKALSTGKVDLLLGINYSAVRDKEMDYTQSVFTMTDALVVPSNNKSVYNVTDLKNKVVSLSRSSDSLDMLNLIRGVKVNLTVNQPYALQMVLEGRSDAYIGNPWTARFYLNNENKMDEMDIRITALQTYEYAFAVKEGNSNLLHFLNKKLKIMNQQEELRDIQNKWFNPYKRSSVWLQTLALILGAVSFLALLVVSVVGFWNYRLKQEVAKKTQALSRSFIFQKQVLNSLNSGVISFNQRGVIRLMNDKALEIAKVNESFLNRHLTEHPQLTKLWTDLEKGGLVHNGELLISDTNKKEMIIHYEIFPLLNEKQEQVGWSSLLEDITEQKGLQKKLILQEKLKALGQLVTGIAHELRNPLTSMKVFIELLPKKLDDPRFREEVIKHVPAEIKRLNNLVEDLLDFTRRKELIKEWVDIKEMMESLIHTFEMKLNSNEYLFILDFPDTFLLNCDRHRIKQVLINLLANAVEAVERNQEKIITICARKNKLAFIEIGDNGPGMSEEVQSNIFQPFFTTKGNGIGLGLYITYNIVQEHGGEIEVQSSEGKGTKMTLIFGEEDFR
ncbi:MAG: transporter substrate-binding domain-containing protein [Heyndrickxia sp.]